MDRTNQDVVGEKCVRNDAGELSLSDDDKMKAWVEHYSRLLNVEFKWSSDLLPEGPPLLVTVTHIRKAGQSRGSFRCHLGDVESSW